MSTDGSSHASPLSEGQNLIGLIAAHKKGAKIGLPSVCSAHPTVLTACAQLAAREGLPLLIESTCNQVNQEGGYTGLTPAQFAQENQQLAQAVGLPLERLILGGDHLGPYPWRKLPAEHAMDKAARMVNDYVRAGYTKIHLDTSMSCADDRANPLSAEQIAQRSAQLAKVAEAAAAKRPSGSAPLSYVIGTEVPTPGGAQVTENTLKVTSPVDAAHTLEVTQAAFLRLGLEAAWERVLALVVQPGVEFGDETIHPYDPAAAAPLKAFVESVPRLVYEAHSTDYQTPAALRQLVQDHFAILKVGPGLTFALREALFALEKIEEELAEVRHFSQPSHLGAHLEAAMQADPHHWQDHYDGKPAYQRFARRFSFSDRLRYYWGVPEVAAAVARLLKNLGTEPLPLTLLSQYLPQQYSQVREHRLDYQPIALLQAAVTAALRPYLQASGLGFSE